MDFILVGQGLAGSLLAFELIRAGKKILVYDVPGRNQSSRVAAGLFNPITGRRFVKTWKADLLFPYLTEYYKRLENELNSKFFYPMRLFRPFFSIEEKNEVISKTCHEELGPYVDRIIHAPLENHSINTELGGIFLKNTGYLDIPCFLDSIRQSILSKGEYREESFEYDKLELNDEGIRYKAYTAKRIIFCDGIHAGTNPFFKWLPFRPVKGEILIIQPDLQFDFIFNRQIFILPCHNGLCKVGATYSWDFTDGNPTEDAKNYLEKKLKQIFKVKYIVVEHLAGIRPATRDRRPFLGLHQDFPALGIFNGLGSKGVSLAPYFARHFVEYLLTGKELDKEVDIKRYY